MSLPSIVSYGAAAKTSTLVWDSDLTIPDGYAIESASGEVGIVGDVSVSGSLNTEGAVTAGGAITSDSTITATGNVSGDGVLISGKPLVVGENVGNANVTLTQIPNGSTNYTSSDFPINNLTANVQYIAPALHYNCSSNYSGTSTFSLQAKLSNGSYTTIASVAVRVNDGYSDGYTQIGVTPPDSIALRYTVSSNVTMNTTKITTDLNLSLTPLPVY